MKNDNTPTNTPAEFVIRSIIDDILPGTQQYCAVSIIRLVPMPVIIAMIAAVFLLLLLVNVAIIRKPIGINPRMLMKTS